MNQPDDDAVDAFAVVMKEKMARSRAKGRDGWDSRELCSDEKLARMLVGHLTKENEGNFIDLACLAMMLHHRQADSNIVANTLLSALPPGVELWMIRDSLQGMSRSLGLTIFQAQNAAIAADLLGGLCHEA